MGLSALAIAFLVGLAEQPEPDVHALQVEQRAFIEDLVAHSPHGRSAPHERDLARDFLVAKLSEAGISAERWRYRHPNIHPVIDMIIPPFSGANIVATIPATEPGGEVVLLGAHFDTEADSPGADDNATGLSALFVIAKAIADEPVRSRTLMIAMFDEEEEDRIGSRALARQLTQDDVALHSMHSLDMAGWDGDSDNLIAVDAPDDAWLSFYQERARPLGVTVTAAHYDSSDHVSFRDVGIPAMVMGEAFPQGDYSPHRHKPTDTPETVNYLYLALNTHLMHAVIHDLVVEP